MPISPNNFPLSPTEQPGDAQSAPANAASTEVTHYVDGSGAMRTPNNTVIERDVSGNFNIYFPSLKRVEIADITAIVSHQINRVLNSTSHVIHFVGGGFFTMAYDQHGNLLSSQS